MRFSIVVPAFNAAGELESCLASALSQDFDPGAFEVLVVDDASDDSTRALAERIGARHGNLRVFANIRNGGPGIARNTALDEACGDWLVFLDSDDALSPDALTRLASRIDREGEATLDILAFDWRYLPQDGSRAGGRPDGEAYAAPRDERLERYLSLQMDGSVIFTAMRRAMVERSRLRFAPGFHEDVDFLFRALVAARSVAFLDEVLYYRRNRAGSIVNSIDERHLNGFARAWVAVGEMIDQFEPARQATLRARHEQGWVAVVATRLREIERRSGDPLTAARLYAHLHALVPPLPASGSPVTRYERIAACFAEAMAEPGLSPRERAERIGAQVRALNRMSWSCTDLQHSLFLAPDQVRTCCKRFFVDGKMCGDVPLMDVPSDRGARPTSPALLAAKRRLHERLNRRAPTACDGCPFLEFRDWAPLERLDVRYLSLEQHSVCNLRCTYCSDTYYGGAKPRYDVAGLVAELREAKALDDCATVVWGGGEPTVGKQFPGLVQSLVDWLPRANHRVLTNAVQHSRVVNRLLGEGRITITTSVDAGTEGVFALVRGRPRLRRVLANLRRYATADARAVTVKYIFVEENAARDEVRSFVQQCREFELTGCCFQISSDFKREGVTQDVAISMILLYGLLMRAGADVVFFDDLLRQRLSDVLAAGEEDIRATLAFEGLADVIADPRALSPVVIWGAGWVAKYLMERSRFCRDAEIAYFVDSTPNKVGTTFEGRPVRAPSALLEDDLPVAIAAAQSYPIIHRRYRELGVPPARLVRQLIL